MKRLLSPLPLLFALLLLASCGKPAAPPAPTAPVDMELSTLLPDKAAEFFSGDFDPDALLSLTYQRDEEEDVVLTDPQQMQEVFLALSHLRVLGVYQGDEYVTDRGEGFFFQLRSGETVSLSFDFGKLSLRGTLYECSGLEEARRAVEKAAEAF